MTAKSIVRVCILWGACVLLTVAAHATEGDQAARATQFWDWIMSGQHSEVLENSIPEVAQALEGGQLAQMQLGLKFQFGEFERIESIEVTSKDGFDSVSLSCRFALGDIVLRLVLDAEGKLAGLWLDKAEKVEREKASQPETVRERAVEVVNGDFELPGTLSLPTKGGPFPVVVLVHGSGPHDQDESIGPNRPFRDIAWGLAERGVAVLRYEKRTKRYQPNEEDQIPTIDWEAVDDAVTAAELARSQPEIDSRWVFVGGHSLGAMAAPRIAARDGQLAGLILIAGSPRSILDLVDEQVAYLAATDGVVSEQEKLEVDKTLRATAKARQGSIEEGDRIFGAPSAYWAGLHDLDPAGTLQDLDLPALIVHGGRDYQIPVSDAEVWRTRLAGKPNVEIRVFEDLNHLMIAGDGPSTPEEYQKKGQVDEAVIADIATWVLAHSASTPH